MYFGAPKIYINSGAQSPCFINFRPGPGMGIPIAVFEEKYEFELRDREFYSRSYLALQAISATEAEAVEG